MIHCDGEQNHLYRMQQKLISLSDDYWIENVQGQRVFFVDSKTFFLREHLGFKDMQGNELLAIQEKVMHIKDIYSIFRSGNKFASIKKVLITPHLQRFEVHVAGAENMEVEGNIREYEYGILEGQKCVAEVSKKWFQETAIYGVYIHLAANHILILAITVIVDMMLD